MNYKKILKEIADREQISPKEVEEEMTKALRLAGLNCSVKAFLQTTTALIKEKTIYSNSV